MSIPNIVKRTNKYVYLDNDTHMTHSDFHQFKQGITNELAIVHAEEFKNSIQKIVVSQKALQEMRRIEEKCEEELFETQNQIQFLKDSLQQPATDWEKSYRDTVKEKDNLNDKINKIAQAVYSDFEQLPILKGFKLDKGIKFILQEDYDGNNYRFRFDPYQMVTNWHSSLSQIHQHKTMRTVSGGWMMTIENRIILYSKSGDYGSYNNDKAIDAAEKIFPYRIITSHPDKSWEEIKHLYESAV